MQPTTSQQALSQLESAESSSQNPNDILQAQNQQYGVGQQQQTVQGLQGAINNTTKLLQQVAPSVMGRTGNSLVTAAQAAKQVENESAPLNTNLTNQTNQYNQANSQLSNLEQQAQTAASGIYQGQQDKLSYLQNIYNNLYQSEQAAAQQAYQQQQLAEQAREANLSAKSNTSSSLGNVLSALLGGGSQASTASSNPTTATLTGGKSLNDAANALKALLATNNGTTIRNTISAIQKSASYGNTYDQAKLQLINSQPEFAQYLANFNGATF